MLRSSILHTRTFIGNRTLISVFGGQKALMYATVVGVTKMINTVPRAGVKPTSLVFRTSALPLHHIGSLIWEILGLEWDSNPHLWHSRPVCSTITPHMLPCYGVKQQQANKYMLPDVTTISTPTCLCSSLP